MKNIEEFWKELNSFFGEQMIEENYNNYCKRFNFSKGEKVGISGDGKYGSLLYLLDHLFLFEAKNGDKYYISNTYMTNEEIEEVLIKYNLSGYSFILGTGFWNDKTTAILFNYEKIEELRKEMNGSGFYK